MRSKIKIKSHLREAIKDPASPSKFEVILIQEGLGNLRDCFYYTKESLQNAVSLFEGKKSYGDHTTSAEQSERPERSTHDILGYYNSLEYREGDDGRGMIAGILTVPQGQSFDWARDRMKAAVNYAQQFPTGDFVGLSIDASGQADEIPIDEFLQNKDLPKSVLPKLNEAKEHGITTIRVVTSLTECESCDLVTEAGAGGKILKMIEMEKKPMKKISKDGKKKLHEAEAEVEKKESKKKESEALENEGESEADGDAGMGGKPDHEDADQDMALFKQMIKQYLGDDHEQDQEAHEMAKHAYEACQADGMSHEMAYEAAGKHLAMSKKVGKKMAQASEAKQAEEAESESESEAESHECGEGDDDGDADDQPAQKAPAKKGPPMAAKGKAQESASVNLQKQLLRANAEIARLKEALKKFELKDHLERKLSESKKPVSVTKKFREALGSPRSKEHIDQAYKLFMAAYESATEEADDFSSFVFTEKSSFTESEGGAEGSFEDCVE